MPEIGNVPHIPLKAVDIFAIQNITTKTRKSKLSNTKTEELWGTRKTIFCGLKSQGHKLAEAANVSTRRTYTQGHPQTSISTLREPNELRMLVTSYIGWSHISRLPFHRHQHDVTAAFPGVRWRFTELGMQRIQLHMLKGNHRWPYYVLRWCRSTPISFRNIKKYRLNNFGRVYVFQKKRNEKNKNFIR